MSAMQPFTTVNPRVMHGSPCFAGTRVTVQTLFDHLRAGYTVDGFLEQFPSVDRQLIDRLLTSLQDDVSRLAVPA